MTAALPTRKDERWRYADLEAVARLWPAPPARLISVPAGESRTEILRIHDGGIHDIRIELGEQAALNLAVMVVSQDYARVAIDAHLQTRASIDIGGVILGAGEVVQEIVTDICHEDVAAISRQRVRIVLDDLAVGSFLGKITVPRKAQQTDADQSARAIVLKRAATANLKPELEIFADDVMARHGCTVGELDKNALFYLQTRGILREDAENLLTQAFVADAFDGITDADMRSQLEAEAASWLAGRTRRPQEPAGPRP